MSGSPAERLPYTRRSWELWSSWTVTTWSSAAPGTGVSARLAACRMPGSTRLSSEQGITVETFPPWVGGANIELQAGGRSEFTGLVPTSDPGPAADAITAASCVLRLRARMPDHHRPFRVRVVVPLAGVGIAVFGTLALVSSVTVSNHLNPAPLVVIAVVGAASSWYVVSVVPKLRAAEEARRAARTRRRPSRSAGGTAGPS